MAKNLKLSPDKESLEKKIAKIAERVKPEIKRIMQDLKREIINVIDKREKAAYDQFLFDSMGEVIAENYDEIISYDHEDMGAYMKSLIPQIREKYDQKKASYNGFVEEEFKEAQTKAKNGGIENLLRFYQIKKL